MKDLLQAVIVVFLFEVSLLGIVCLHKYAFVPGSEAQKGFDEAMGIKQ